MPLVFKFTPDVQLVHYDLVTTDLLSGNKTYFTATGQIDKSYSVTKDITPRNWKAIIKRVEGATTYMDAYKVDVDYHPGFVYYTNRNFADIDNGDGTHHRGDFTGGIDKQWTGSFIGYGADPAPNAVLEDADNQALASFYSHARSAQTQEQGGTFIAEINQTIHGIRRPAEALTKFFSSHIRSLSKKRTAIDRALRRNDVGTAKRIAGTRHYHNRDQLVGSMVTNSWLESRFHWVPLVSDIESSAKALAQIPFRKSVKRIYATGNSTSNGYNRTFVDSGQFAPITIYYKRRQEKKIDVKYYGAVKTQVSGDGLDNILAGVQGLGLNLSNFVPTIYNVIPYSFVADYFSNLGDVIDAMSFPNSDIAWVARTAVDSTTEFVDQDGPAVGPNNSLTADWSWSANIGSIKVATHLITRRGLNPGDLNAPSLTLKVPGIDKKWLNLSALAAQLFVYRRS